MKYLKKTNQDFYNNTYKELSLKFNTENNVDVGGKFEAIPTGLFITSIFKQFLKGSKFIDVGCGYGNIVKLAKNFGMDSKGIEIEKKYKKFHNDISVIYTDAKNFDYSGFDTIYMYRPMLHNKDMYDIISRIFDTADKDTRVIYTNYGPSNIDMFSEHQRIKWSNSKYNWEKIYKDRIIPLRKGPVYWSYNHIQYRDTCIVFDIK